MIVRDNREARDNKVRRDDRNTRDRCFMNDVRSSWGILSRNLPTKYNKGKLIHIFSSRELPIRVRRLTTAR